MTRWAYNQYNRVISMTNALGNTWEYRYDDLGNLVKTIEPNGAITSAAYDLFGQTEVITDVLGHVTKYDYDLYGNLVKTTDAATQVMTSTYDIAGRELAYKDANQHLVGFGYDGNDNITTITDPKLHPSTFTYDRNNLLLSSVDRRQVKRTYRYDNNLKLIAERDFPGAPETLYGYDKLYRRTLMTDTLGFSTRYAYDPLGRTLVTTDTIGAATRYTYDEAGNLTAVVDPLGARTEMTYDTTNRLSAIVDAAGHRTQFCYDAEDRLVRTIGPRPGEVTSYRYDKVNRLIFATNPHSGVTGYEYDLVGNRTVVTDTLGYRTEYRYDVLNRLITEARPVLPDGMRPTIQYGYDPVGNTTVITSPRGFATHLTYDENDNVATFTDPLNAQTRYTYDEEDNRLTIIDPNGHTSTTTYNPVGLPLTVRDGRGFTTRLEYDPAYNLVRMINAEGHQTVYEYDPMRRLIRARDPLGQATRYRRDKLGRVVGVTDANDHTTAYSYDAMGRLLNVTDALGSLTRYAYDEAGNLISIGDANNHTTLFKYDLLNQLVAERNPIGNTWRYAYDPNSRLAQRIDALGRRTSYEYDSNNRLVGIDYGVPQEQPPIRFAYDLDGNQTDMCDGLGCARHTYDGRGDRTSTTDWLGRTTRQTYDGVGNLLNLIYPDGRPVRYEYDETNQVIGVTDPHNATSVYKRNGLGQVTNILHPNRTAASFSYDAAGRLTGIDQRKLGVAQPQSAYSYTLDKVGNRSRVRETRAAFDGSAATVTLEHGYQYDALNRLVRATTAGDLNNDGEEDLVALHGAGDQYTGREVTVYLQVHGKFPTSKTLPVYLTGGYLAQSLAVGDVNNDGLDDLVVTTGGNAPDAYVNVFLQGPSGLATTATTYPADHIPGALAIGDVNHDGRDDVVVAHDGWRSVSVYPQAGGALAPYVAAEVPYSSYYRPNALALADFDGNGGLDAGLVGKEAGLTTLMSKLAAPTSTIIHPPEAALFPPGTLVVSGTASIGTNRVQVSLRGAPTGWVDTPVFGGRWQVAITLPPQDRAWWIEARAVNDLAGLYQAPPARRRIRVENFAYAVADNDGATSSPNRLMIVGATTAAARLVGDTGTDDIEAIAFKPGSAALYAADGGKLGTLNLSTGKFSSIGNGFGKGNGAKGPISFNDVDGLAFDPSGALYGVQRRSQKDAKDLLFRINPATGQHIPDAFGPNVAYKVISGTLEDIDDIAFDAAGTLYGVSNNAGRDDTLVTIDPATGVATVVDELDVSDVEGLAFANDGQLYGATGHIGNTKNKLYMIDKGSGDTALVGQFSREKDYEGIAFPPAGVALPPLNQSKTVPHVDNFTINGESAGTASRDVSLAISASNLAQGDVRWVLFIEYAYDQQTGQWVRAQPQQVRSSDWLPYTVPAQYPWRLSAAPGVKYLQAWVADSAGNVSPFAYQALINYIPPSGSVARGQTQVYRYRLSAGQRLTARLNSSQGDADLYIWSQEPDAPAWVSNLSGGADELSFEALAEGIYQVEVYGYTPAEYRLTIGVTTASDTASHAGQAGGVDATKPLRDRPFLQVDSGPGNIQTALVGPAISRFVYLPLVHH